MTTDQMKQFITAANCLNFTEAAKALFISPSSLSRNITGIERELNIQLFYRDNRSVRLTPAGKVLLEDLKKILDDYLYSVSRAQQIQRGEFSTLNIGILDGHMISGQFPMVIRQLEEQHPNISVNLFRGSFGALVRALYSGDADLIISLEFSLRHREQLRLLPISRTHDYLAVLASDPLAQKSQITPEDISNSVCIGISAEDSDYANSLSQQLQHTYGCILKDAPNLETCTLWAQAGLGFAIINSHNYLSDDQRLRFIDLDDIALPGLVPVDSDLVIACHTANLNPALPIFLDLCQDYLSVSPPPVPSNLHRLHN